MTYPTDYDDILLLKITVEKMLDSTQFSPLDREIFHLRIMEGWLFDEIAEHVGQKYFGRKLWDRAIRYRFYKTVESLRNML